MDAKQCGYLKDLTSYLFHIFSSPYLPNSFNPGHSKNVGVKHVKLYELRMKCTKYENGRNNALR